MSVLLIVFLSLLLILIIFDIIIFFRMLQKGRALKYAFNNTIQCDDLQCPIELKKLPPVLVDNLSKWDKDQARYSFDLVQRVAKSAITSTPFEMPPSVKDLGDLKQNDSPVFGKVLAFQDTIWIAFRGTIDQQEFIQDIQIVQDVFSSQTSPPIQSLSDVLNLASDLLIHSGFQDTYLGIKDSLDSILKKNASNQTKIIIAGHSLGAGVATIAGANLSKTYPNIAVYTFASPRTGNNEFCEYVTKAIPVFRVINEADLIPTLPWSVTPNFKDKYSPYFYSHCGEVHAFNLNWKSILNNHVTPIYSKGIEML